MADIAQSAAKMEYQEEARYPKNPFYTGSEAPCRFVDIVLLMSAQVRITSPTDTQQIKVRG